jgi:hypothetical protein
MFSDWVPINLEGPHSKGEKLKEILSSFSKVMQDCLAMFCEGLQLRPNDPFFQQMVCLLNRPSPSVSVIYEMSSAEAKKYLGEKVTLPYSRQTSWDNNRRLVRSMVIWVLRNRAGAPQQIPSSTSIKSSSLSSAEYGNPARLQPTQPISAGTCLIPPYQPTYSSAPLTLSLLTEELKVQTVTWRILEDIIGVPIGSGPYHLQSLLLPASRDAQSVSQYFSSPSSASQTSPFMPLSPPILSMPMTAQSPTPPPPISLKQQLMQLGQAMVMSTKSQILELQQKGSLPVPAPRPSNLAPSNRVRALSPKNETPPSSQMAPRPATTLTPRYFASQVDMAQEIFSALRQAPTYSHYVEMDFRIILPPKVSLTVQTQERLTFLLWSTYMFCQLHSTSPLQTFEGKHSNLNTTPGQRMKLLQELHQLILQTQVEGGHPLRDKISRHDRFNPLWLTFDSIHLELSRKVLSSRMFSKGRANADFHSLCDDIYCVNPKTKKRRKMMLIIADECHYGIQRHGQVDILFNGARHKNGSNPNPTNALSEPNVFVISVSATGWNHCVAPYNKIVQWNQRQSFSSYISLDSYTKGENRNRVLVSSQFDLLSIITSKSFLIPMWSSSSHPFSCWLTMLWYSSKHRPIPPSSSNWRLQPTSETLRLVHSAHEIHDQFKEE